MLLKCPTYCVLCRCEVSFNVVFKDVKRLGYDTCARGVRTLSEFALQPTLSAADEEEPSDQADARAEVFSPKEESSSAQIDDAPKSSSGARLLKAFGHSSEPGQAGLLFLSKQQLLNHCRS